MRGALRAQIEQDISGPVAYDGQFWSPDKPYVLAPREQSPFNQKVFRVSPGFGEVTDAGILRIVVTETVLEGNIPGTEQVTALIELEIGHGERPGRATS